ncbi:MAG: polyribonucleotide nucleotidyltransferase [Lentimicrobiaceae bacterium]|nr:polyribonucleotide nucleotidyltransferase [Lentimicrobiaceae bacterium]
MGPLGIIQTIKQADGQDIIIETGRLAKQADGAVVVKVGKTMLLATVVSAKTAKESVDFMPLSVDYKEKYAATGKFPGGFFKREARPSDYEILIARLVDRALRPLFPDDYHAETQVLINLISGEQDVAPDAYAALAASAALAVSDIPFNGPISEVRVAHINGEFVINPPLSAMEDADLDLMVAASIDNIMMVEGESKEVSEATMLEALKIAHDAIKVQCQAQIELAAKVETAKSKREYCHENNDEELREDIAKNCYQACYDIAMEGNPNKHSRSENFEAVLEKYLEKYTEEEREEKAELAKRYFHDVEKKAVRDAILNEHTRLDGRSLDQIRPIWTEVDYLPSVHGSAIFTRGETQSLVTVTLGSKLDEQTIDGAVIEGTSKFMLHYNFPGFSTGEAKPNRGVSRREIGHGNLAERALKPMIPTGEENPYTIRVVSDILESNGSSSMASVCGGTLALMDAGVQMRKPVAGIAMGLISDSKTGKYAVLSDILGDEDHLGDMDFKVTGTADGITACQMDIKVDGLTYEVLEQALEQARKGRIHILGEMAKTIDKPRPDYKEFVPRIEKMIIDKEFIGAVIGPGGKIIQEMQRETNTVISIEEEGNFGIIEIMSQDKNGIEAAKARIKGIVAVPEIGEIYRGKVKNIMPFGAFVEILPGKDALLHISEISYERLETVEPTLKEGDEIDVKLIGVDPKTNKLKLSRKVLLPKPEGYVEPAPRPPRSANRDNKGDRDRRNNNRDNRNRR